MKCEFEYCIYNRAFECIVDNPKIGVLGRCDTCIIISLEKKFFEREKERQLLEIENRWSEDTGE